MGSAQAQEGAVGMADAVGSSPDVAGPLSVSVRPEGLSVVVEVAGEVDIRSAAVLGARLDELVAAEAPPYVVLDLSRVGFVDSSGLGSIVRGHKRVRAAQGRLALVVDDAAIRRLFEMCAIDRVLRLHRTLAEALADAPADVASGGA